MKPLNPFNCVLNKEVNYKIIRMLYIGPYIINKLAYLLTVLELNVI